MGLNKHEKVDSASSNVAVYQKSIFDFLNPFIYNTRFNLWDISRFIFTYLLPSASAEMSVDNKISPVGSI